MKEIVLFIFILLNIDYTIAQTNNKGTDKNFKKLEWVLGKWSLISSKPGISGTESWSKISSAQFNGLGITLDGKDTVSIEKIKVIKKGNDIFYVADVKENREPVYFKFTKITDQEFVCENPKHDFPKKINYKIDGNNLKATISGEGKAIEYVFEKK